MKEAALVRSPDHVRALKITSRLVRTFRVMYKRNAPNILPQDVIKILNNAGVKFTLVGAHAIGGWLDEPRSTQDVDVLVHSQHRKAVQALQKAYPNLTVQHLSAVTRFLNPSDNEAVIDLIKPQAALHKAVAKNAVAVGRTHRIPDLEMCLALKYAAIVSPNRTHKKKLIDRADFIGIVTKNYEIIDSDKLFSLGEMVRNRGGREISKMVADAKTQGGPDPHG